MLGKLDRLCGALNVHSSFSGRCDGLGLEVSTRALREGGDKIAKWRYLFHGQMRLRARRDVTDHGALRSNHAPNRPEVNHSTGREYLSGISSVTVSWRVARTGSAGAVPWAVATAVILSSTRPAATPHASGEPPKLTML